jgi:glycerophosphoryl diester phosphodiesterase
MSDATSFIQEKYNSITSFMKEYWAPIMFIVFCILMYFIMQKPNKTRTKNTTLTKTYARNVYRNGVRIKRSIFTIPTFERRADGKKIRSMSLKQLKNNRKKYKKDISNQRKKLKELRKKYEDEVADEVEMYINNKEEELKYIRELIKAKESEMKKKKGKKSKKKSKKKRKKRKRQNLKNPFK